MADAVTRASAVVAWSYDKNRAPTQVRDDGRTVDLRPSELRGGNLIVSDFESGTVYEARDMGPSYYVDIGTDEERLFVRSSSSEHRITDRRTDKEYEVKVSGNEVTVKGAGEETTLEVY